MRFRNLLTLLTLFTTTAAAQDRWIEFKSTNFSVFYQHGYEHDARFARTWLHRAEVLMKRKYGVTPEGYRISFYLYPAPSDGADVGLARTNCCERGEDGLETGSIQYLAPSAAAWKSTTHTSSLGLPFDKNFHAKVIMSEYISVGYLAVQDRRGKGWNYYSAPDWFVQGLEEFDAIFHSTKFNRRVTRAKLLARSTAMSSTIRCCSPGVVIPDVYNGGALFVAFLADQFGESIHRNLLRNPAPTFSLALESETGASLPSLYAQFQRWLQHPAVRK